MRGRTGCTPAATRYGQPRLLSFSSRLGRTALLVGVAFAATAGIVGALDGGDAAGIAVLVALAVALGVATAVAGRGTKPTCTREASEELGVSVERVDFLLADGVLDLQRNEDGSSGITRESVERERRYSAEAPPWRQFVRLVRRVAW